MNLPVNIGDALRRVRSVIDKKGGAHVLHTNKITRQDRELLLRTHWLQEIMKGWYLLTRPDAAVGDSTPWYASFWDFVSEYLEFNHGKEYCLSAECSLDIHVGDLTIPKQVIAFAKKGSGVPLNLPYNTSLLIYSDPGRLPKEKQELNGLQVMTLPLALCRVNPNFFHHSPMKAEVALRSLGDVSSLLDIIIASNLKAAADRLVGAYRFLGMHSMATDLEQGLSTAGIVAKEKNPFEIEAPLIKNARVKSASAIRILAMWGEYRSVVLANFSMLPPKINKRDYLKKIQELYARDAYNSLSIEGYQVTQELIERVQNGDWSPERNLEDSEKVNALAARGYYEAFQDVKKSINKILNKENPGTVVREDIPLWYQKLFGPAVRTGLLRASDLFGWRKSQVYIRGSRHTPLGYHNVPEAMDALFQCLENEPNPMVRAILGHFVFVYIHPYMDGNGRIARFLMNTQFASGGYPWVVVPVDQRAKYFASLESASVGGDIEPFTRFINALFLLDLDKKKR